MEDEHPKARFTAEMVFFWLIAGVFFFAMAADAAVVATKADPAKLPPLKAGDLVFQTLLDTQSLAVMFASNSLDAHMGVIEFDKDGQPEVVEAIGPVKETPLPEWIHRGAGERLAIRRLKQPASEGAMKASLAWARAQLGKPYNFYFLPGHSSYYCSQLVREAYEKGAGLSLGRLQKVGELHGSAQMEQIISERWKTYPLCRHVAGITREKCRTIIMQQELVTPASIAADPHLGTIYSNYPFESW